MTGVWAWEEMMSAWRRILIDPAKISIVREYDRTRSWVRCDGEWLLLKMPIADVVKMKEKAESI